MTCVTAKWLGSIVLVAAVAVAWVVFAPYGPTGETFVEITPGTSTVDIADKLQKAGVIRSTTAFDVLKEFHGGTLKAGEYLLRDHPASVGEV